MSSGPENSARNRPVRAGQRLSGAGQLSSLVTVQPALNLIVAGVEPRRVEQGVSLECPVELAESMTVWASYDAADLDNNVQPTFVGSPDWPASQVSAPTRRIFVVVKWGTGGGQNFVEFDVSEGVGVTVPTNVVEVYAYSESTNLDQTGLAVDPQITAKPWTIMVHASPGRAAKESRRTRQVVQPKMLNNDGTIPESFPQEWNVFINRTLCAIDCVPCGDGDGDGDGDVLGYFDALAQPVVPHPNNNEFDNVSELAAYTTYRVDASAGTYVESIDQSNLTVSLANQNVRFNGTHRATPLPSADFSVWTKISNGVFDLVSTGLGEGLMGLMIGDDTLLSSPATADVVHFTVDQRGAVNTGVLLSIVRSRYNATGVISYYSSTSTTGLALPFLNSIFLRMRWRASPAKMFFDVSADGVAWTNIAIGTNVPLTPTRAGIHVYNNNGTNTAVRAEFLRFSNSAAFDQYALGRVV